jgi:hypothetical protein
MTVRVAVSGLVVLISIVALPHSSFSAESKKGKPSPKAVKLDSGGKD